MRLTEFIEEHRRKIIKEWVGFAASLLPWAKGISERGLQDHAEELLTAVVSDMKLSQSVSEKSEKSKGHADVSALGIVGKKHAAERLGTGFNINQLVSEYRALRASVLRLWEGSQGDKQGEVTRFNEAIDETLAEATARYSALVNDTREQFVAILGHDLRSPLAAIVLSASTLMKSENLDDKEVRISARILGSAERMSRLVNDLLDLTRTRFGSGIPIVAKQMDLKPVCQQVISEIETIHPACQFRLDVKGDLHGTWDSDRLTQLITNLVTNAVEHGGEHGAIGLVAQGEDEEIVLQVHNEGQPIHENALKKIFLPMVRNESQDTGKNPTGLGLGLFIAHEVVTAHGGTIRVTSTEKEGTTFRVHVPRRAVSPTPRPVT